MVLRYGIKNPRAQPVLTCFYFQSCQVVMYRNRIWLLLFLMIFITVPWRRLHQSQPLEVKLQADLPLNENITIGLMSCAGGFKHVSRGFNETMAMNEAAEEPLTLIKSVLISAKLSKVEKVEFHIFTDSWMLEETIQKKLENIQFTIRKYVQMFVNFYNVFDAVPHGYERDFIDNIRKCGYVRVFFPRILPSNLKEILYLDTDVIVTGNIEHIWKKFKQEVVVNIRSDRPRQLAALVPNSEVYGNVYLDIYKINFHDIPHVPPRGVNSGVMFMNLDAMREFNWTQKIMEIFRERRNKLSGDQQLINIIFHDNLDRLTLLPCQYNFQHLHCEKGLVCLNVTKDAGGIQIMHGAGGMFHQKGRSHNWIYQAFKMFKLELHRQVVERLLKPLINFYSKPLRKGNSTDAKATCNGTIGKYLFQELVE